MRIYWLNKSWVCCEQQRTKLLETRFLILGEIAFALRQSEIAWIFQVISQLLKLLPQGIFRLMIKLLEGCDKVRLSARPCLTLSLISGRKDVDECYILSATRTFINIQPSLNQKHFTNFDGKTSDKLIFRRKFGVQLTHK